MPERTNNPPGPIEFAQSVIDELATWMCNHPVVETEDDARAAKVLIDRARAALVDIEVQRVKLVSPLNEKVAQINADHKHYHNIDKGRPGLFDKILSALMARIQSFMLIEEARKKREAEEARKAAEEAERLAREAEAKEKEALDDASQGVFTDVAQATTEADGAFADFQRASRFAKLAEKETKVKVSGGFGRSLSIKNKEILTVKDWRQAIVSLGLTDGIRDAILTAARNYRQEYGELPPGIEATHERKI
jgi:HPt (histidine-containing phosphotransfer) domain-containing protein